MKKSLLIILVSLTFVMGFASKRNELREGRHSPENEARVSTQQDGQVFSEEEWQVRSRIEDAARDFSPEGTRRTVDLLSAEDPRHRVWARESLLRTGEPNGIPALRLAALRMNDPAEARAYREAADLLERRLIAIQPAAER